MAPDRVSVYQELLPSVFRQDPLLSGFLLAFERLLVGTGRDDPTDPFPAQVGLEALIEGLPSLVQPLGQDGQTPDAFLPWLARWVGLSLDEHWPAGVKRRFIQQACQLHSLRGTPQGLQQLLELYLQRPVQLEDQNDAFPPYYFEVTIRLDTRDPVVLAELERAVRRILDEETPACLCYGLRLLLPRMQLTRAPEGATPGVVIGVTTLLGNDSG